MGSRMNLHKFAFLAAAFLALTAQTEPAVQPGGDIPADFKPTFVPPPGGDIPKSFNAPRLDFQYIRREAMIPMRDGARLYTVLIIPRGVTRAPIMLDRTPYSAEKATSRNGQFGPWPENILSALSAELVRAGYIVAVEDVRGKYKSEGDYVMNRPVRQTASKKSDEDWFTGGYDDYNTYLRYGSAGAYGQAMRMDQLPFWQRLTQHPAYDPFWQGQAVDKILAAKRLTVPTLLVGSLWDQEDIYGAPAAFNAVKASSNAHLVLGPWHHGQANGPASSLGPFDWGGDTGKWFRQNVMIPFLNQYLKDGPPSGIARVTAFEAGVNQWQRLPDWPSACTTGCPVNLTPLYLAPGSRATFAVPAAKASDAYISDPAKPVTYRARPNLSPWATGSTWRTWLVDDQRFADARPDVLSYSSEPLSQPLRLAGTPLVHLVASTSGTDSDWVVKLIDIYPDQYPNKPELGGYQLAIAMDVIRGRYRTDPARPAPLTSNAPLTYEFALPAVDYVVQPGHRLMVQVQSSWFPLYDRNPQTYVPNIFFAKASDYRPATQRVFTGPDGSWIGLPLIN
jgi:putative CocE/NonD family hydrolase